MSHNNNNSPAAKPSRVPSNELIDAFLRNQGKELELRARELDLQHQTDSHNYQYATAALEMQAQDRADTRANNYQSKKMTLWFAGGVTFLVVFFLGFALYMGKDLVAMEVIKAIIFLISGGSGGYALGRSKQPTNQEANSDE